MSKCIYCGYKFRPVAEYYVVQRAMKPKGYPRRWKPIGKACVDCGDSGRKLRYGYDEPLDQLVKTDHNDPD